MNKFEQFKSADINTQLALAMDAVNAQKGLVDTHNKRVTVIICAALAVLTYAGGGQTLVAVLDSGVHSINGVFIDTDGRACLSTMATATCDRKLSFDEYAEVFNRDIGPGWYMGDGCSISNVTPFDFHKEII